MTELYLYSGDCLIGKAGDATDIKDAYGEPLFVGDIVCIYSDLTAPQFTVVSDNRFQSYSDGTYREQVRDPFVMGIKSCHAKPDNDGWHIVKVKSHSDLVAGERWPAFGFSVGELNQTPQEVAA